MSTARIVLLAVLVAAPLVVMVACGASALWQSGLWLWVWWILPVCWGGAYLLSRRRTAGEAAGAYEGEVLRHWSARDRAAAEIVAARQAQARNLTPERLTDPQTYLQSAVDLTTAITQHYHPGAKEPLLALTAPELLAAAHLAIEDLEQWCAEAVPGSHLLTLRQWRGLSRATQYAGLVRNAGWVAAAVLNPLNVLRYLTSRLAVDPLSERLQTSLLTTFHALFLRQVGYYAIEMNSGRLAGGAARYRAAMQQLDDSRPPGDRERPGVTAVVIGQAKAGKTSLINALLGARRGEVDVLPMTREVAEYRLPLPDSGGTLSLLDTPGYADGGYAADERQAVATVLQRADLVLLAMNVSQPARGADLEVLETLVESAGERKLPPVVGVLTFIDRLSPVLEWAPPYDWLHPERPKEQSIAAAVEHVTREFDGRLAAVVPVCSDSEGGRASGAQEQLAPVLLSLLDESRACAVLRGLHQELSADRARQLYLQLWSAGRFLLSQLPQVARNV